LKFSDFINWYRDETVAAGPTFSQREGEPFLFCQAPNAVDFNNNLDFVWCADGYDNWISLSSPAQTEIFGLWLMAPSKKELPSKYDVLIEDSQKLEKVIAHHEEIRPWGLEITFDEPQRASKVKLHMTSTYESYPLISEINIISKSIKKELSQGRDMSEIIDKIKAENSKSGFWVNIEWVLTDGKTEVKKSRSQFINLLGGPAGGGNKYRISLLESEFRADTLDKFLKFHYKSVLVKFPKEAVDGVKNLNFISKY
jgi:hypothetical protein